MHRTRADLRRSIWGRRSLFLAINIACVRKTRVFLAALGIMCKKNAALLVPSRLAKPAQQQVERARASIPRLRRRHRKDVPPQPRLFEPPRYRSLEDPRPGRTEAASGDDQNTAPSGIARPMNKSGERAMGLGLGHSVQIEPAFDRVETALQPLGTGPVYPREPVEAR